MSERVVITGMGVVCPIGNSVAEMWEGLMTGRHGMNQNTLFDASAYPTTFDAEVKNYDLSKIVKNPVLHLSLIHI